jgi:hypothetical protein
MGIYNICMKLTISIPKDDEEGVRTRVNDGPLKIHKNGKVIDGKTFKKKAEKILKKVKR